MLETKRTYAVFDVETTIKSDIGFAASPYHPENQIVLAGYMNPEGRVWTLPNANLFPFDYKLVVGANLKFDLAWSARYACTTPARLVKDGRIWDVCLAEYILQRQRVRMPSLEDCARLRGITGTKLSEVSELIKNGVCPSIIPAKDLAEYHTQDLVLTQQVFLAQFAEASKRGMLPLMWSQMEALLATTEMEYNGIRIDVAELGRLQVKLVDEVVASHEGFITELKTAATVHPSLDIYLKVITRPYAGLASSNKELSTIFFGGTVMFPTKKEVGVHKNGKTKYKTENVPCEIAGLCSPSYHGAEVTKLGYYTVDDNVLKSIEATMGGSVATMAMYIRKYRDATKQLSTYVDGTTKHLWPDGKIHCSFHHNVTLTGRLSCSSPNLQNQTDGDIKKCYIPDEGYMFIEFDYAQLEVVGLAVLSGDEQLKKDISDGTDIHTALYEDMYGRSPTVAERKAFKPLTFGLIYGAGAKTLADNSGLSVDEARKFIRTFYARYAGVQAYHRDLQKMARDGREPSTHKTEKGMPAGKYVHRMPTGREYEFYEYDTHYPVGRLAETSFSPTELKNWPIQGWSTGDVVPLMIGHVVRKIAENPEWCDIIRPVVTVHDSVMFEVPENVLKEARNYLTEEMSKTREVIEAQFGYDIGLELKVESKVGYNWKEMYA